MHGVVVEIVAGVVVEIVVASWVSIANCWPLLGLLARSCRVLVVAVVLVIVLVVLMVGS